MSFLLIAEAIIGVCGAALVFATVGQQAALSFASGALLMFLNLGIHVIVWPRILVKKQVALSIGVIVFKFAILGWIIYEVATGNFSGNTSGNIFGGNFANNAGNSGGSRFGPSIDLGWFGAGLGTVVLSVLTTGLSVSLKSARLSKQIAETAAKTAAKTAKGSTNGSLDRKIDSPKL